MWWLESLIVTLIFISSSTGISGGEIQYTCVCQEERHPNFGLTHKWESQEISRFAFVDLNRIAEKGGEGENQRSHLILVLTGPVSNISLLRADDDNGDELPRDSLRYYTSRWGR